MDSAVKVNLKSLGKRETEEFIARMGLPAFRARQLMHWIYDRAVSDINDITEFSKELRALLAERAYISSLKLAERLKSADGTEKYLFGLDDGETVESVLIPDEGRLTLCVSSQVGCAMGCKFCRTGDAGLRRNLMAHEIADQVIAAGRLAAPERISNIVLMGMGEPLNNFDEVIEALVRMAGPLGLSRRKITLSTSGLVPQIRQLPGVLKGHDMYVNLAVSLNAATDEVRDRIMPVNRRWPISELLDACREYPLPWGRRVTFEYVMLAGVNDSPDDAKRLVKLLRDIQAKVNLIPFNEYAGSEFRRPDDSRVAGFQRVLDEGGVPVFIRKSKGQDILASCGQLRWRDG